MNNIDNNISEFLNSNEMIDCNNVNITPIPLKKIIKPQFEINIITDSGHWCNVYNKWLFNWLKKKLVLKKANPDLSLQLWHYSKLLNENNIKVNFIHVYSHQKTKRCKHADSNDIADVLATSSSNNDDYKFYKI
jgi:ribonuclease HI